MEWEGRIIVGNAKTNIVHCIMWSNEISYERERKAEQIWNDENEKKMKKTKGKWKHRTKSHIWLNGWNKCWCAVKSFAFKVVVGVVVTMHFCVFQCGPYPKWPFVQSIKHFPTLECKCWIVKSIDGDSIYGWWVWKAAGGMANGDHQSHHHSSYRRWTPMSFVEWLYYYVYVLKLRSMYTTMIYKLYSFLLCRPSAKWVCSSNCIDMLNKFVIALPFRWKQHLKLSNQYVYNVT